MGGLFVRMGRPVFMNERQFSFFIYHSINRNPRLKGGARSFLVDFRSLVLVDMVGSGDSAMFLGRMVCGGGSIPPRPANAVWLRSGGFFIHLFVQPMPSGKGGREVRVLF